MTYKLTNSGAINLTTRKQTNYQRTDVQVYKVDIQTDVHGCHKLETKQSCLILWSRHACLHTNLCAKAIINMTKVKQNNQFVCLIAQ